MSTAVYYSGGPYVNTTITVGNSIQGLINAIRDILLYCRWTLAATTSEYGGVTGYKFDSKITDDGTKVRVYISFTGQGSAFANYYIILYFSDTGETHISNKNYLTVGPLFRIWATPWELYVFKDNGAAFDYNMVIGGNLLGQPNLTNFCFWSMNGFGPISDSFRQTLVPAASIADYHFCHKRGATVIEGRRFQAGIIPPQFLTQRGANLQDCAVFIGANTWPVIMAAMIATDNNALSYAPIIGFVPDAVVTSGQFPINTTGSFDNHPWEVFTYGYALGSLWKVTGPAITQNFSGWSH